MSSLQAFFLEGQWQTYTHVNLVRQVLRLPNVLYKIQNIIIYCEQTFLKNKGFL